jgi:hypothetical protein
MGSSNRSGWQIGLLVVVLAVLGGCMSPGGSDLKSPEETYRILEQLRVQWLDPGPPVIVFSNPG